MKGHVRLEVFLGTWRWGRSWALPLVGLEQQASSGGRLCRQTLVVKDPGSPQQRPEVSEPCCSVWDSFWLRTRTPDVLPTVMWKEAPEGDEAVFDVEL